MKNSMARRVDFHFAAMSWVLSDLKGGGRVPASVMFSSSRCWGSSGRLATALAGRRIVFLSGDQQPAERVQVSAQDCQLHVSVKASFRTVAATLQAIAGLQRADRRFYSRVMLLRGQEFLVGLRLLNRGLLHTGLRQTEMIDKSRKRRLVLWRMEAAIERQSLHAVGKLRLQRFGFANGHILVAFVPVHQNAVNDEAGRVFEHQPPWRFVRSYRSLSRSKAIREHGIGGAARACLPNCIGWPAFPRL